MQRVKTAIQHQIDLVSLKMNGSCDIVECKSIRSARKETSENFKRVLIQFILFVLLHDSLTLQIILRVKPIMLRVQTVCKRSSMGAGLQQMVYKHSVIGQNIKQQNFNKGSSEGKH